MFFREIIVASFLTITMVEDIYTPYFRLEEIIENIEGYLKRFDRKKFQKAFYFAMKGHEGQMRKDNVTPYFVHPVEVVNILMGLHVDEDVLIAGLLHDVPEDTKHTIKEVKALFGETVGFLVDGATKLAKVQYKDNMREAEVDYLKKFFLHSAKDPRVILIKLADRLHNMQTLQNIPEPEKRIRIAKETLEIYVPIANLLGIQEIRHELEELCFRFLFPSECEQLSTRFEALSKIRTKNEQEFIRILEKLMKENEVKSSLQARKKNLYSIYKKLCAEGKMIEDMDSRIAVRILVSSIEDCYKVLGLIHGKFLPKTDRFRDYIANPKNNGYQSLHTTVFGVNGILTDIQIRTEQMEIRDEYGVASVFFDDNKRKSQRKISLSDEKQDSWVNKILKDTTTAESSDDFLENLKLDILQDRIFVFTPKGTTVDLPKAASALDFAYSIHTEVGNHAFKANINGKLRPISTRLHTGEVVEIITNEEVEPQLSWLSFVKTNTAKGRIITYLKHSSREDKLKLGHQILQKEFDMLGWGLIESLNFKKLKEFLNNNIGKNYSKLEEVVLAVGEGEIKSGTIIRALGDDWPGYFSKNNNEPFEIDFKVVAKNRNGLLRDVTDVVYQTATDISFTKGWVSRSSDEAFFSLRVTVASIEDARKIFSELEQIEDVKRVYRVSRKGVVLFSTATFFAALVWILHPVLIRGFVNSTFALTNPGKTNFLIYCLLFGLLSILIYLNNILKRYFPMFRNKLPLWAFTFAVPLISTASLAMEIIFSKLNLSWFVLFGEMLVIYVYLGISYRNLRKFM